MTIRAFIALKIEKSVKEQISTIQSEIIAIEPNMKVVNSRNIHLTLKFLGNIEEKILPEMKRSLIDACDGKRSIELHTSQIGLFTGRKGTAVVWVDINGDRDKLDHMVRNIDLAMKKFGFDENKKKFIPHLTIGRMKNVKSKTALKKKIKDIKIDKLKFTANQISLVKSDLTSTGAIYTNLHTLQLNN